MKKSLVVLLIAVLAVSSVFAALTGKVVTTAKYNLYPEDFADGEKTYNNLSFSTEAKINGSYKVPFDALFAGEKVEGKTDNVSKGFPYAVVEASLEAKAGKSAQDKWVFDDSVINPAVKVYHPTADTNKPLSLTFSNGYTEKKTLSTVEKSREGVKVTVKLDKAEIIGDGWKLDFINGPEIANYSSKTLSSKAMLKESCDDSACTVTANMMFDSLAGTYLSDNAAHGLLAEAKAVLKKEAKDVALAKAKDKLVELEAKLAEFNASNENKAKIAANDAVAVAAKNKLTGDITDKKEKIEALSKDYANAQKIVDLYAGLGEGMTFTWNKYGSIAVAANANEREEYSYYRIQVSSVDYAFTDELKAQASVTFDKLSLDDLVTFMSGKVNYKNATEGKLVANVAVDAVVDNVYKENGGIELDADVAYDEKFITGEYYYASHPAKYKWGYEPDEFDHIYEDETTAWTGHENFSWFLFGVDGTAKAPKFTPVLSVEGYAYDNQKLVANWDLKAGLVPYIKANIGMKDTLNNLAKAKSQQLYAEVSTEVSEYKDLEGFGKLSFTLGCKDFLNIKDTASAFKTVKDGAPIKDAKKSGLYFNVAAEDFIFDGLDFIFSAVDLCNKNAQVFAFDAAYADDQIKAAAGFSTGLKNSIFNSNHTFIYGDVNVKINEDLSAYAGAEATTDKDAHYYVGGKFVKKFTAEARLDINAANGKKAGIGLYAKVSTKDLVKGAELALQYGALNSTTKQVKANNLSEVTKNDSITATCTITF